MDKLNALLKPQGHLHDEDICYYMRRIGYDTRAKDIEALKKALVHGITCAYDIQCLELLNTRFAPGVGNDKDDTRVQDTEEEGRAQKKDEKTSAYTERLTETLCMLYKDTSGGNAEKIEQLLNYVDELGSDGADAQDLSTESLTDMVANGVKKRKTSALLKERLSETLALLGKQTSGTLATKVNRLLDHVDEVNSNTTDAVAEAKASDLFGDSAQ